MQQIGHIDTKSNDRESKFRGTRQRVDVIGWKRPRLEPELKFAR